MSSPLRYLIDLGAELLEILTWLLHGSGPPVGDHDGGDATTTDELRRYDDH